MNYNDYYYYGCIGTINGNTGSDVPQPERKYVIVQSLWTKPIKSAEHLRKTLFIAALSLAYAHNSGYKVHMHTDSKGYELLKKFGYDKLEKTLDAIPASVPTELFAAGKFYAMRAEAEKNGIQDMTLSEINEEIRQAREENKSEK